VQINVAAPTHADPCAAASDHWRSAESIATVAAFEDHLARFPNCAFAELAKARIANLKSKVAVVAPPVPPIRMGAVAAIDLTGIWSGNDGGTYTIRQSGTQVTWEGASRDNGMSWSHSFNGVIRDHVIVGKFFDHPPGRSKNSGELTIRIVGPNRLNMIVAGAPFGGSVWVRRPQ
jgi:hypothetical protein